MNAKKLVMLLAVVAIAVGVWFMMQKPAECDCCMTTPSADDPAVMVMTDGCECEPCEEAAAAAEAAAQKAADEAAAAAEAAAQKAADEAAAGTPAE